MSSSSPRLPSTSSSSRPRPSEKPPSQNRPPSGDIVSSLLRASASIPPEISNGDLDRFIREMIVKEAREKAMWVEGREGRGAAEVVGGDDTRPNTQQKPNTRFLSSIIKGVSEHNQSLLRDQAHAAREARKEASNGQVDVLAKSGSHERREISGGGSSGSTSRGRTTTKMEDKGEGIEYQRDRGAMRLFSASMQAGSSSSSSTVYQRQGQGRHQREHGRWGESRSDLLLREEQREREMRSDLLPERSRSGREHQERDRDRDHSERLHHGPSRSSDIGGSSSAAIREYGDSNPPATSSRFTRSPSPPSSSSRAHDHRRSRTRTQSRSSSPPPPPRHVSRPIEIKSKMDHLFSSSYDPKLDFTGVLPIPREGLVPDVGWDHMLNVLSDKKTAGKARRRDGERERESERGRDRQKGKEKEKEKSKDTDKGKKRDSHRYDHTDSGSESSESRYRRKRKKRKEREQRHSEKKEKEDGKNKDLGGIGQYEYVKKGGTREWDVGK